MGRDSAAGRGCVYALQEVLEYEGQNLEDQTIAIQGFGNLGRWAARIFDQKGAVATAISDSSGAYYNPTGLDIPHAIEHKAETGSLEALRDAENLTNQELLTLDTDCRQHSVMCSRKRTPTTFRPIMCLREPTALPPTPPTKFFGTEARF
jgi:glutamate dehydrogenase/leucine dehydrogenase